MGKGTEKKKRERGDEKIVDSHREMEEKRKKSGQERKKGIGERKNKGRKERKMGTEKAD